VKVGSGHAAQHAQFWEQQWLWWDRIEAPLRPQRADVELMQRVVAEVDRALPSDPAQPSCGTRGSLQALLLGVTPELAAMRWPTGTALVAVDRSQGMIDHVWPMGVPVGAKVLQGDWLALPLGDGSCDVVLGDGCFSQVSYPHDGRSLVKELRRVLRAGGVLLVRTFIRPERHETVAELFEILQSGAIGSFHAFKWRLNMALQPSLEQGVRLGDVWEAVVGRFPDPRVLAHQRGWSEQSVDTIHAYQGSAARFYYPTLAELRAALGEHFDEGEVWFPQYELGERCPHLRFVAR
jgi:SAM-dependent methyltransferase